MIDVMMFSGGKMSWAAAKRAKAESGDNLRLLFADTMMEDEDLYRFIKEAAADVGAPLITIADGRNPWEVFKDTRFLGNTRIDPCSRILKRELIRDWVESNDVRRVYFGISWDEAHRWPRIAEEWLPYEAVAPMMDEPQLFGRDILKQLRAAGIEPPRLYAQGFPHNNCGGFCIKAGQAQFPAITPTEQRSLSLA